MLLEACKILIKFKKKSLLVFLLVRRINFIRETDLKAGYWCFKNTCFFYKQQNY